MALYNSKNIGKVYLAAGAINETEGVVGIGTSGALAMTLPNPPSAHFGMLVIVATTAQAHTVTNTTGFNAGSTSSDVGTFGGAIGDSLILVAIGGVWYVVGNTNVTLA